MKDWDSLRNYEGQDPDKDAKSKPAADGFDSAFLHHGGAAPHADIDVLDTDVGVDNTCNHNSRACDPVRDLADKRRG